MIFLADLGYQHPSYTWNTSSKLGYLEHQIPTLDNSGAPIARDSAPNLLLKIKSYPFSIILVNGY